MRIKRPNEETLEYIKNNYIYDPDTGKIDGPSRKDIGYIEKTHSRVFWRIDIKNKHYRRSHLAWFLYYGEWPKSQIDHEDRNSLNDEILNLREVDNNLQQQNKDNYTGYRGFSIWPKNDGKWRKKNLVIRNQRHGIGLGYAENREEAIRIIDEYWKERGYLGGSYKF